MKPSTKSCALWIRRLRCGPDQPRSWNPFAWAQGTGVCSSALESRRWHSWLEQLPGKLDFGAGREIHATSCQTTGRRIFELPGPEGFPVFVKCYPDRDPVCRFDPGAPKAILHPSRAFLRNVELWRRGLAVPEPLALLETGAGLRGVACYAVTRLVEGCQPLLEFAFEHCRRRAHPRARIREWAEVVLHPVIALHQAGYAHGDLHHHNILIRPHGPPPGFQVFLTDFDLCRPARGTAPRPAQLLDLARLGASLYQVVPRWTLAHSLGYYFRRCRVGVRHRKQGRTLVSAAYRRVLGQYLACFSQIEACCFARAERDLTEADASP